MSKVETQIRRHPLGLPAIVLVAALVLIVGGYGLTFSPLFRAKIVRIEGERRLGERQVMRLAGVEPGVNVFHLDAAEVQRRLEADPRVAAASVTRHLPSTVVISVTERVPVAVVADGLGGVELVGADGVAMGSAAGKQDLPAVGTADGSQPTAADLISGAAAAAAMASTLRPQVEIVAVATDGSLRLTLRSGVVVSYGPAEKLDEKGLALEAVLRWAQQQGEPVRSVDVSVPAAPTATLAGGAVASP